MSSTAPIPPIQVPPDAHLVTHCFICGAALCYNTSKSGGSRIYCIGEPCHSWPSSALFAAEYEEQRKKLLAATRVCVWIAVPALIAAVLAFRADNLTLSFMLTLICGSAVVVGILFFAHSNE